MVGGGTQPMTCAPPTPHKFVLGFVLESGLLPRLLPKVALGV